MIVFLRVLRLLTLVVWVGGLIFFALVLAPVAFHVLPSTHEAGIVVGATLRALNAIGFFCGLIFLFSTIPSWLKATARGRKFFITQMLLVVLMIGATCYVSANIIPAMERDRLAAGGDVDAAAPDNPARLDFERLHPLSEKLEGSALFLGLGLVILIGMENPRIAPIEVV